MSDDRQATHVFVSYVRADRDQVDRLCKELTKHGVNLWLDRNDIKPGHRWKDDIRKAIQEGDFFIACFSKSYSSKRRTYMNQELNLAIEVLGSYPTDRAWFIPVLLEECDVPARSIGGIETLLDIQWVSLYADWDAGVQRILDVIQPIPAEVQKLLEALGSGDVEVRKAAARALDKVPHKAAVPALIEALNDEHWEVSGYAFSALKKIGTPAVSVLVEALSNEDEKVSREIIYALAKIADPIAIHNLGKALGSDR